MKTGKEGTSMNRPRDSHHFNHFLLKREHRGWLFLGVFISLVWLLALACYVTWDIQPPPKEKTYVSRTVVVVFEPELDILNATILMQHEEKCSITSLGEILWVDYTEFEQVWITVKVPAGRVNEYIEIFESYDEVEYAYRL